MSSSQNTSSTAHVDIDHVARLARLELSPEEKARFEKQFDSILGYFDRLNSVDVSGVEPTAHALPRYNIWRDDTPGETFSPAEVLANAPAQRDNQILVPKVIE
jgi:aspartyl-tRNA(Asn)/glutamyl-tRNA(Gln) amidotransferase subunit C